MKLATISTYVLIPMVWPVPFSVEFVTSKWLPLFLPTTYFFYWNSHFKTWMLKQLQTMIWVQLQLQTTISSTLVTTSGENHLSITQNIPEKSKLKDRFHQQVGTPSTDHLCNINPWKVLTFTIMYFVAIEVDSIFQRIFFQYCLISCMLRK